MALEQLLFEIRHARADQRLVNRDAFRRWRKRDGRVRAGIGEPLFGRRMNALSSLGDKPPVGVEILNALECNGAPYQQCEKGNPTELNVERKRFQDLTCLKGEADVFLAGYHVR